jgi:parallel beta-helix repeat protein
MNTDGGERTLKKLVLVLIVVLCFSMFSFTHSTSPSSEGPSGTPIDKFSIFWITDTQHLASENPQKGYDLTSWIVNYANYYNVKMVVHTGDLVDHNDATSEWEAASAAMSALLNNSIPYCWCAGNHDQIPQWNPNNSWIGNRYLAFNQTIMQQKQYWVSDICDGKNTAVRFSIGNLNFLLVDIEFKANSTVLAWVDQLLDTNKNSYAILATHGFLDHTPEFDPEVKEWAETLNSTVLAVHPNVRLTLNGHNSGEHGAHLATRSTNELVFDRQESENFMGAATVAILTFDVANNQIEVKTYDLNTSQFMTDPNDQFTLPTTFNRGHITTVPEEYPTIQEAINAADSNDTIFVRKGKYYEHLIINKSLTLIGEDRDLTVIDGDGNGEIADIQANNVYIGNFTLQNAGIGAYGAVWVQGYNNAVISNNTMVDNHHGVCVWTGALNVTISGNLIYNKQPSYTDGIRLGLSSGHLVTGNTVINESTGIGLDWTSNNIVRDNLVVNNFIGIGAGNPSYNNVFSENTIANNSYGFLIAIYNSKFFHNNIVNNAVHAAFYGQYTNAWNNSCEGNYWSDYIGTDSNSDGIGDTPYVIDSSNLDHYPLMNQYWNPADVNHDLKVELKDVYLTAKAYGYSPGHPRWNPHCDINEDGKVELKDYYTVCKNYGKHW